jgi:hypothetical protein
MINVCLSIADGDAPSTTGNADIVVLASTVVAVKELTGTCVDVGVVCGIVTAGASAYVVALCTTLVEAVSCEVASAVVGSIVVVVVVVVRPAIGVHCCTCAVDISALHIAISAATNCIAVDAPPVSCTNALATYDIMPGCAETRPSSGCSS